MASAAFVLWLVKGYGLIVFAAAFAFLSRESRVSTVLVEKYPIRGGLIIAVCWGILCGLLYAGFMLYGWRA
jgi:hypothetical protein